MYSTRFCRIVTGHYLRLLFVVIFLLSQQSRAKIAEPQFSMTYNILETAAFFIGGKLPKDSLTYLPFHLDFNFYNNDFLGFNTHIAYRYESYNDKGPLYSTSGKVRAKQIWTNFNEFFLLFGPRFSPLNTGLLGFYINLRAGFGSAFSPRYFNASFLISPEAGYTFSFKNLPHLNLTLGAGLLINLPFYETIGFAVPWSKDYVQFNALHLLVHNITPLLNLGLGFNL